MCLSPIIVLNPAFPRLCNSFTSYVTPSGIYSIDPLESFTFGSMPDTIFRPKYMGVTLDNIDKFYFVNVCGETLPMFIACPCNKCLECSESRRVQICNRMNLEAAYSSFTPLSLTLTYNDSSLPSDGVSVRDVQLFIKRFRTNWFRLFGEVSPIRFAFFSEYGVDPAFTRRAHYHAALFNVEISKFPNYLEFIHFLEKTWNKGFVYCRTIDDGKGISYLSKYVTKGTNVPLGKNPNFWLASRGKLGGLGSPCLSDESFIAQLIQNSDFRVTIRVCGTVKTITCPTYIYKKVFPRLSELMPRRIINHIKSLIYHLQLLHTFDSHDSFSHTDFNYLFPPDLYEKYSAYFNISSIPYNFNNVIAPKIITGHILKLRRSDLTDSISHSISVLEQFMPDLDEFILRAKVSAPYRARFVEAVRKWAVSRPDSSTRFSFLQIQQNKDTIMSRIWVC